MSYYDDDDDDDYSSEEEDLFYHNYSVDYANQILGGQHTLCSALPRQRRKRRPPRLMRVSTWDQMPIETRHRLPPASSLHSRPKNNHHHQQQGEISSPSIARLPSLEATGEELERRANRRTEPPRQEQSTEISSAPPLNEGQLRQVQQQQEAFQQHLLNIQRHLNEQQQQPPPPQQPQSIRAKPSETRREPSSRNLDYEDDQAEIADLIERDPYFAAAMEDFVHSHGLMRPDRHRSHSNYSSSSSSASSSGSASSIRSRKISRSSQPDQLLLHELHSIRRLMEKCFADDSQAPFRRHHPTVQPEPGYQPARVPRERRSPVPMRPAYENVVSSVKEALQKRPSSQLDQPLLPSQIDPRLKRTVRRPPPIPVKDERSSPLPNRIPDAPPYEALSSFSSAARSVSNGNRRLSYGNERKRRHVYDRFERRYSRS